MIKKDQGEFRQGKPRKAIFLAINPLLPPRDESQRWGSASLDWNRELPAVLGLYESNHTPNCA
jgi:hypothetical protein